MPIIRRFEQNKQSLEEFYKELIPKSDAQIGDAGTLMLKVLKSINKMFKKTVLYGLTSHASLLIFNNDFEDSDYYIVINAFKSGYYDEYRIEYVIPENDRPWEGATINGSSTALEEFEKMVIISMYNSRGWKDNSELEKLYHG
ncbi:hypothetical protein ACM40_16815 [Chryseobacterium sp. BLS98]|jgi:hypothetical protein|uniref:hypothetical protein n=1 Tax=Chryseobacterium sp. BLS98 TaxID=885586 RepID=UPI00065AECDC|nr:hypothetical protein [Chryseobacterium sp. BLS98]KMQ59777.1 hypothetical protein ACM40_16815 [Chryseobacterium sp. BLS98]